MALQVSGQITITSFDCVAAGAYHDIFVGRFEPYPLHTYGLDSYTYHLGQWLDKEKVGITTFVSRKELSLPGLAVVTPSLSTKS